MKFILEGIKNGCRVGRIVQLGSHSDVNLETPMCMLYTRGGSAPYISRDVLDKVKDVPNLVHMPLPQLADHHENLAAFEKGIAAFSGLEGMFVFTTTLDPATAIPSGYNDKTGTAIWGRGGKLKLDVELFMKIQESLRPTLYQCLSDGDTDRNSSKKRLGKSVDRTLDFLDQCLECHQKSDILKDSAMFGVIEGGYNLNLRLNSARETADRKVAGFCIEGFHNPGPDTEKFHPQSEEVKDILVKTLAMLPSDKPRAMFGVWAPDTLLEAVELGIDIFDSSFSYIVTERGGALTFQFSEEQPAGNDQKCKQEDFSKDGRHFEISLKDKRYLEDMSPVLEGCTCYTCKTHTRSYVHHLLNTSELLASILLMIHNFHHYFQFFIAIRKALATDSFSKLKDIILKQKR